MSMIKGSIAILLSFLSGLAVAAQMTPQKPSPMLETTRPHPRIAQTEAAGRRVELASLKGAVLFVSPKVKTDRPVPLVIHFHGAAWLTEYHVAQKLPRAALITVNLGSGSRVYGNPFSQAETFQKLIDEAAAALDLKKGFSSITLVGFSAGYGAVRAILRHDENFQKVDNVLLLDGIHASYEPEGKVLAEGGAVRAEDLDSFVRFAREAAAGKKTFVITHSEIFPGTYASTTECVDFLLAALGLKRRAELREGPIGMQQLSRADAGNFHIRGFAGTTAPDHVDHLQAMSAWFKIFRIK